MKIKRPVSFNEEKDKKWDINLSDKTLTESQEGVLKLGFKFSPAPTKLPLIDTVTAVEIGTKFLSEVKANGLRGRVCDILRKSKLPQDNLSKQQRKALSELKRMSDVAILPAYKVRATVLMNKEEYHSKLTQLIQSGTY